MNTIFQSKLLTTLPYFKKEKLSTEQKFLEKQIIRETSDLNRVASIRWSYRIISFKKVTVFDFYESTITHLISKLYSLKSSYELEKKLFKSNYFRLFQYILPADRLEKLDDTEDKIISFESDKTIPVSKAQKNKTRKIIFTKPNEAPEYYVLESQNYEAQCAFGESYANKNISKGNAENKIHLTGGTPVINFPLIKETFLGNISRFKLILTWFIVAIALVPDFIINCKILGTIYEFNGWELYVTGSIILLISKLNSILFYGSSLKFFQNKSEVFNFMNIKINRFYFITLLIGFIYCISISVLFYQYKVEQKLTTQLVLAQQNSIQIAQQAELDNSQNSDLTKSKLAQNNKRINQLEDKLFSNNDSNFLKIVALIISGLTVLLFSSILFSMALIFSTAFGLRKKVERGASKVAKHQSEFNRFKNALSIYRKKVYRIISLHGQVEFLRRLAQGTPRDVIFYEQSTETNNILPLEPLVYSKK